MLCSSNAVHIGVCQTERRKEKRTCRSCFTPAPEDAEEECKIHKLAGSRHAPGHWIFRARIIALSWKGLRTAKIAEELDSHPETVLKRLHRFNTEGLEGLGDRPRAGRRPRITVGRRALQDHGPGLQESAGQAAHRAGRHSPSRRRDQGRLLYPGDARRGC